MASKSNDTTLSLGLLVLRVGAGVMLIAGHGWPKLVHFSERAAEMNAQVDSLPR